MMNTLTRTTIALGFVLFSPSAMAQTAATGTVNVIATVTAACSINTLTSAGLLATADFSNGGSSAILTAPIANATLATGDCNTPTHIKLTTLKDASFRGADTAASTSGGYTNYFDYTADVTFSGVSTSLTTTAGAAAGKSVTSASATSGAANGPIGITVTPVGTPTKLQVGSYLDTLTIELTAN